MLNLYEILQKVLNESVDSTQVSDAINNRNYVEIRYVDDESRAPGTRLIQPYAYGLSMAGNEVLRAFQPQGDTFRGIPHWKTFRLDRIVFWKPRKQTFNMPPSMQGYNTPAYNDNGDGSMSVVFLQANFGDLGTNSLEAERAKTKFISNAPKLARKNVQGPIPYANQQWKRNVYTSQPGSKKYAQWAKNIDDTATEFDRFDNDIWAKAEAEKQQQNNAIMQNNAAKPKEAVKGPIDAVLKNDKNNNEKKIM